MSKQPKPKELKAARIAVLPYAFGMERDELLVSMNEQLSGVGRFEWQMIDDDWALTCDIGPVAWRISLEGLARQEAQDALVKKVLWLKGVLD